MPITGLARHTGHFINKGAEGLEGLEIVIGVEEAIVGR